MILVLFIHRCAHRLNAWHVPILPKLLYAFNRILFATVVPPGATIGKDVILGYKGLGIVIHRRVIIGDRVNIGAGVTIGGRGDHHGVPVVEDDVLIGTGAKILGPVRLGRGAKIGANAVVLSDVPPYATAVGIPARIISAK